MLRTQDAWSKQLKEVCKLTGASWAVWIQRTDNYWQIRRINGLSKSRLSELNRLIGEPDISSWLAGALSSGRLRWRSAESLKLGCQRIYLFPNSERYQLLVVGSSSLTTMYEAIFKATALTPPIETTSTKLNDVETSPSTWKIKAELESSYNPQEVLDNALDYLAKLVGAEAAYLAIRTGNLYRIQSTWKCTQPVKNVELVINQIEPLEKITHTKEGVILYAAEVKRTRGLPSITKKARFAWMGIPILVSQRVVGIAAFEIYSQININPRLLQVAAKQITQIAYHIENAIIFSEAAHYLEQMALLNELSSTVSVSMELNEVSRRMMHRLRRAFDIDWAAVFLLFPDDKLLKEYGGSGRSVIPREVPLENSLVGHTILTGGPIRVNDLQHESRFSFPESGSGSELAVPMKYRGKIIGAIDLFSNTPNAFSSQDEQLLVLIAGHLAGLFENMRLNQEAQERARKLQETVLELRAVRETALDITSALDLDNLLTRIAHRAQVLVDARGAELGLLNEKDHIVDIVVSVTPWENLEGIHIPFMAGVAGRMAVFGEPLTIADYNAWSGRLQPERIAPFKAVAGVPLKFKGQVIGTLTVMDDRVEREFIDEDVRLLELLAPQAAISIRNAQLYQELEERIEAQQRAESNLVRSARLAAVGEMAAGVAHELNNPLTTVTGFVELALDDLPEELPCRSDLELALQEALRAREVVRRLLDFSRPTDSRRIRTNLCELVDQVLFLINHLVRTNGIHLVVEHCIDLPWISVDPSQIQQVLLNLLHNALQAMPSGGILTIQTSLETRDEVEWTVLRVTDNGEGISPENLERIFEPFFTTRSQSKGTGLGLSVSYGIMQSHGGFIDVQSQVGQGTTFAVYLPVQPIEGG